jgi:hypothetical protein
MNFLPCRNLGMRPSLRLDKITSQLISGRRSLGTQAEKMAKLDINTKYKMLSAHEIPALGYGVCSHCDFATRAVWPYARNVSLPEYC